MKSINFDNPYLLLIALAVFLLLLIPFFIAIRKENCTKKVIVSLILHLVMTALVVLGVAGIHVETVVTETQVYVVADVSYSANKNLDVVDDYIRGVQASMPLNSKMGVVSFGRDYELTTPLGSKFKTVSGSDVDDSATNIADALKYTGTLFDDDVIKRLVLITDGRQTDGQGTEQIITAIENLYAAGVKIDSIYLDDNIKDTQKEVQLTGVEFTKSTYLNHETTADVLVQSTFETEAILTLYRKGSTSGGGAEEGTEGEPVSQVDLSEYQSVSVRTANLGKGFNVINFTLDTTEEGVYDYLLKVEATDDVSQHNNQYSFTQSVAGKLKVLAITASMEDAAALGKRYVENADVEVYVKKEVEKTTSTGVQMVPVTYSVFFKQTDDGTKNVTIRSALVKDANNATSYFTDIGTVTAESGTVTIPYTVEELCLYDEIAITSFDVREMDNSIAFIENLDTVVSQFGKSLITAGDLLIQNQEDEELKALQNMLPVNFGASEQDPKLYGIVIDASRSMEKLWHLTMAKQAATQLVNLLNDDDYVTVVAFSGEIKVAQAPVRVGSKRSEIIAMIQSLEPQQGTYLGAALQQTLKFMNELQFYEEQVMLITDGASHTAEPDDPTQVVKNMRAAGIVTSVINTGNPDTDTLLYNLSVYGGGSHYYVETEADIAKVMLEEIADEVTETVIEAQTHVQIQRFTDDVLDGVSAIPDVYGFINSTQKASATTVLTVNYQKSSGGWVEVPLYAYWNYGNGKVTTFTSTVSGAWIDGWDGADGTQFFQNVLTENTPKEKTDYPYTLTVTNNESQTLVEIVPYLIDPKATANLTITTPSGEIIQQTLTFDTVRYFHEFGTEEIGRYDLQIVYERNGKQYAASTVLNVCYLPEYDEFANYDASRLHQIVRHRGTVSEDGKVNLENEENEMEMYKKYFTVPLMTIAVSLFVIDIIIRKLRWADIKSLFKKTKKTGGMKP